MLTSFVRHKLALLAVGFPLVMLTNPRAFALSTVVLLATVPANAHSLAFCASVTTVLMDAFVAVSTLFATYFVVNALACSTTFCAVPSVLTVWAIRKHRVT